MRTLDPGHPDRPEGDPDSIALRRNLAAFAGWWREALLALVVGAILGAAFGWLRTPIYEAAAGVAVLPERNHFLLAGDLRAGEEEVEAATEIAVNQQDAVQRFSQDTRDPLRAALVEFVENGGVALAVSEALSDDFDARERRPGELLEAVSAEEQSLVRPMDLILITAEADTAAKAAALANAWARSYVEVTNRTYAPLPADSAPEIERQLADARDAHGEARRRFSASISGGAAQEMEEGTEDLALAREIARDAVLKLGLLKNVLELSSVQPVVRLGSPAVPPVEASTWSAAGTAVAGAAIGWIAWGMLAAGATFLGARPWLGPGA